MKVEYLVSGEQVPRSEIKPGEHFSHEVDGVIWMATTSSDDGERSPASLRCVSFNGRTSFTHETDLVHRRYFKAVEITKEEAE